MWCITVVPAGSLALVYELFSRRYAWAMTELGLTLRARSILIAFAVVLTGVVVAPRRAFAIGETIVDVRILDNQRTDEATVRSIAGLVNGDVLEADTLDVVRERLNTTGLFADVNVWWEPHGEGVRVNISVKDKFPWAPVPTASWSANNKSIGLLFVHGNLFGRGKQLVLGGRLATVDSGATIAYRDPSMFGTWIYWQIQGLVQKQVIPEYQNYSDAHYDVSLSDPVELRETHLFSYGFEGVVGIAWLRRVKTQVAWHLEKFDNEHSFDPTNGDVMLPATLDATRGGTVGMGRASLTFDFRAREFAVMHGTALAVALDYASPDFKSDFTYWRAGASWEHGIRFFHSHNLIYSVGANAGHNLPFWTENTAGGPNLRGYLFQQFRGDTQLGGKVEYHFPLFSVGSLDFRGLGFYDAQALWFREQITGPGGTTPYTRMTPDMRNFDHVDSSGFSWGQSVHSDVGVGLRFFLRSVAIPLVGVDVGWGIEDHLHPLYLIVVGA
jgi:outer membrane protein insertion porin family